MKTRFDISYSKGEDALSSLIVTDFPNETLKEGLIILVHPESIMSIFIDEGNACAKYSADGITDWVQNSWCRHQELLLIVSSYIITHTDDLSWTVEVNAYEDNNNGNIMSQFRSFQKETSKL